MADVNAVAESTKAVTSVALLWVPVITGMAGVCGAPGSQWLSHRFAAEREKKASGEKLERERYFIASELVFLLERFA